jgi:uncharacterized protein with HEPN domain
MRDEQARARMALERMRTAIAQVRAHVKGVDLEGFLANKLVSDAALIQLHVLGEEVRRLPPWILDKYAYPWHLVRAQRNVIAHDYFGIRLASVWATIEQDLGPLDAMLVEILRSEFGPLSDEP